MVGKSLSHYKIVAELGRGGMGIVYRAEDTKLDRTVAIKVLPSAALASEDDRARFYREAKAAAQLHHPHIASVFEIDESVPEGSKDDDLRPFIAMEFIKGETLHDRISKGPLKLEEAVRIARQIASGLEAAHKKNIVHRDIKAANVMIDEDGRAKILDFGLAQTAASTKLTRMGSTLGTVAYMSPEQARGEEVDSRTDLWSLGVVLYEMVTGRPAFPGDYEQAVVYEILNQDPEPLTAVRTGVPMGLEWIISKCLAKSSKDRYQTATDLLVDLRNVDLTNTGMSRLSKTSSFDGIGSPNDRSAIEKRSNHFGWFRSALVGIGAALITYFAVQMSGANRESQTRLLKLPLHIPGVSWAGAPTLTKDETAIFFVGSSQALELLQGIFRYDLQTEDLDMVVETEIEDFHLPVLSPDESFLAYNHQQNGVARGIWVMTLPAGRQRPVSDSLFIKDWIDDSTMLVMYGNRQVYLAHFDGESITELQKLNLLDPEEGGMIGIAPRPMVLDGEALIYAHEYADGTPPVLYVYNFDSDESQLLIDGGISAHPVNKNHLIFQPAEGAELFLQAVDLKIPRRIGRPVLIADTIAYWQVTSTLSGDLLISESVSRQRTLQVRASDGAVVDTWNVPNAWGVFGVGQANFSPDGRLYASVETSSPTAIDTDIVLVDLGTGFKTTIDDSPGYKGIPTFSAKDNMLYYSRIVDADTVIVSKSIEGFDEPQIITHGEQYVESPGGNYAAVVRAMPSLEFQLVLREPSTGHETEIDVVSQYFLNGFSPDGKYFMYRRGSQARIVYDIAGESHHEIPVDLNNWGPDDGYIYGYVLEGKISRLSYSTVDGFELANQLEDVIQLESANNIEAGFWIGDDHIVTTSISATQDHVVIRWWQNFATSLQN